jgi:1-deoxy-D-xylulose 5-phosphate reductoisomerase
LNDGAPFSCIPDCIAEVMRSHRVTGVSTLDDVLGADAWARRQAREVLRQRTPARTFS